ncbi:MULTISPECIES: sodium/glutamate symporter [unclassified Colwellia]|jgi:ESS family glutamate:Na+ symporter|uniref:sodium/glutamate symporter n=1 Tax=unclassified Colwellia TaxID=196834 RepID=UPI0015F729A4|nr:MULTISPECIES: sodium/glutamate symporter [unclassified Colwellia]MBA6338434.1 sodium/glutamate symporter [Colwellia sp. BRX8-7]MBA6378391.1 sodium/glutamate symporter [Colwellia sp. BRX10-7]MBA6386725.1 sodium/glutamate symporter [Colwellia sp. BRX10-2]MBA6404984.1 sodium/glutamate symporter [Colwellia sp. BRX10-1]
MIEMPFDNYMSYTIGIVVFFMGVYLTKNIKFLRDFNIPEPVTGGLLAALFIYAVYIFTGSEIAFDLSTRDRLLVYFFTAIGLNARFSDLVKGGKPLLILLVLTLSFIVIQNVVGITSAILLDLPSTIGVLAGSVSLIGGHGTAIAWAPDAVELGIPNALEIGVAAATLGLVVASLVGGPIAKYLLAKYQLSSESTAKPSIGIAYHKTDTESFSHLSFMAVLLVIHICIIIGFFANKMFMEMGLKLPLFVTCLLAGILLSNTVPHLLPKLHWPARTRSLAIVSDFSLSLFLTMSLMSMQLWTLADLAGPLFIILGVQTCVAVLFIIYILFPLMGRNYQAAVLSAGFGGFALGATPTAIANMTAVTKAHGAAPMAFIILPLVGAFFVDITNAFIIRIALNF